MATSQLNTLVQVRAKEVTLPPLCSCPDRDPLNPEYPSTCANNCPLFHNVDLYEKLLRSLLHNYGIAV